MKKDKTRRMKKGLKKKLEWKWKKEEEKKGDEEEEEKMERKK